MAGVTRRFPRMPGTGIAVLGTLGLALILAWAPLTYLTGDLQASRDGLAAAFSLICGLVGTLVARRQPRNPEGWLLLGAAVCIIVLFDSGLYAVLDYHRHQGRLPLGPAAVFLKDTLGEVFVLCFGLIILLFPDGRLTRRWVWVLRAYLALATVLVIDIAANEFGTITGRHIQVNVTGQYSGPGGPTGALAVLVTVLGYAWILAPLFWPLFVARQVLAWRRSTSERRQQLKWLMGGAVLALIGLLVISFGPARSQTPGRIAGDVAVLALAALPVSMGVGILKYHLYDIDRLISRTVAYALVTGLLVGVYAGMVTLATRVLGFASPVGVAASTLAAAALFNPVRLRIQRSVDRRFNRARYDAEQIVAAFAEQLQATIGPGAAREELATAVHLALEPSHVSVWQPPPQGGEHQVRRRH